MKNTMITLKGVPLLDGLMQSYNQRTKIGNVKKAILLYDKWLLYHFVNMITTNANILHRLVLV